MRTYKSLALVFIISVLLGYSLVLKRFHITSLILMTILTIYSYIHSEKIKDLVLVFNHVITEGIIVQVPKKWFTKRNALLFLIAALVFAVHLWIQLTYQEKFIVGEMYFIVIEPFNFLLHEGLSALDATEFQPNAYTGNPFFLLPFIYILGYSPGAFRLVLLSIMPMTISIFFLIYYEVFDLTKAVLGILMLTSMSVWVLVWWPDYNYTILFLSILLLLYVNWLKAGSDPQSKYLYLMSFLGGLFFYFKATVLYMLISIGLAALYDKRENILDFLKGLDISILIVVFIIGASPFLVYNLLDPYMILDDGLSFAGPEDSRVDEVVVERFHHLDTWMESDIEHLFDSLADSEAPNYFSSIFGDFHPFSILLLGCVPFLIVYRQHTQFVMMSVSFYVLLFFLPSTSGVREDQMTVFAPLAVLLLLAAFDTVSSKIDHTQAYKAVVLILSLAFTASIALNISELPDPAEPWNEDKVSPYLWSGEQRFYEEFRETDVSGPVVTNSYKAHMTTKYILNIGSSDFLLPSGMPRETEKLRKDLQEKGSSVVNPERDAIDGTRFYRVSVDEWYRGEHSPLDVSEPVSLVLRQNQACIPREEFCGATTDEVLAEFNIDESMINKTEINDKVFLVARNIVLNKSESE